MFELPLDRRLDKPLYRQVYQGLRAMILCGALAPGTRLPSSRLMSDQLSVSRSTIVQAMSLLESGGLIEIRGRSGHFVAVRPGHESDEGRTAEWHMDDDRLEGTLVPRSELEASAAALFVGDDAFLASPPEGWEELRRLLVRHTAQRGVAALWNSVFLTSGGRQGLALTLHALVEQRVTRLRVPRLCWPAVSQAAVAAGLRPERFNDTSELVALGPADAVYLNPSFSNPTGRTLPVDGRRELLDRLRERGWWLIEDDAYGELRYGHSPVPALRAFADDDDRVIYLGSFAQALCPGLRMGYCLAPKSLHASLRQELELRWGPLSSPLQLWLIRFIETGALARALDHVRTEASVRMTALVGALERSLGESPFERPQGGIYLWLPTGSASGRNMAEQCRCTGLAVAPGEDFAPPGEPIAALRLSISALDSTTLVKAGQLIARLLQNMRH